MKYKQPVRYIESFYLPYDVALFSGCGIDRLRVTSNYFEARAPTRLDCAHVTAVILFAPFLWPVATNRASSPYTVINIDGHPTRACRSSLLALDMIASVWSFGHAIIRINLAMTNLSNEAFRETLTCH